MGTIRHTTAATGVDSADGKISKNAWNEDHIIDLAVADIADLQTALDGKQASGSYLTSITSGNVTTALGYTPTSVTGLTGTQSVAAFKTGLSLAKADVGLGSVDNTADGAKNVLSAAALATPRNINGVAFDGSANITISAVDATARLAASAVSAYGLTLIDDADAATARTTLGLGTLATQSGTFSGTSSGTNTGDQTTVSGNAGTATALQTARTINGVAFDGTANVSINAVDSTARVAETRTIATTAPLTGGGDLSANRTLAITAADGSNAGSMSSANFTKLAGIATAATANDTDANLKARANHTGTQAIATILAAATSRFFGRITASGGAGEELTGTQATTLLDIATGSLKGLMSSADFTKLGAISGTNTGDQTTITGNAGSATVLQNARTIAISGKATGTATSFNGSANIIIPVTAVTLVAGDIPDIAQSQVTSLSTDLADKASKTTAQTFTQQQTFAAGIVASAAGNIELKGGYFLFHDYNVSGNYSTIKVVNDEGLGVAPLVFLIGGVERLRLKSTGEALFATSEVGMPAAKLIPGTAPGTLADGHIWYDSAAAKFKKREAGATSDLGAVSGFALTDGDKGDITVSASGATFTIDAAAVTLAKMANMATDSLIGRTTAATGVPEVITIASVVPNASFRSLLDCTASHVAARAAGTYWLGQGQPAGVTGTGTLYSPNLIYIDSADYPTVAGLAAKLRLKVTLAANDVAPTGNYTFGLYPVTSPGTSGGAAVRIWTMGTVVASSTVLFTAPAADSAVTTNSAEFALPANGLYVIGFINTITPVASSHMHISALLQMRNA